jgi:hypothetical protein
MNNGGDVLARGGRKANFPAAGGNVSQEKWDSIWKEEAETMKDAELASGKNEPVQKK